MTRAVPLLVFATGCSVVFDLSEYDSGPGAGGSATTASGATGTTGATTGASSSTGAGGTLDCGEFPVPPASDVIETFDAGFGALTPQGPCVAYDQGTAHYTPSVPGEYCWLNFPGPRRLTCASFTFKVDEATSAVLGAQTYVYLDDLQTGERAHLILEGGGFQLQHATRGLAVPFSSSGYNPFTDVYWRLRGDEDGNIAFDTSADGVTFVNRAFGPSPVGLDSVQIAIGAGVHSGIGGQDPGEARVDCVNVAPCE